MEKKMIGVLPLWDDSKESLWMLPGYMNSITHAGAIPVILPLLTNESDIKQICREFDGFLFTGGHDLSPGLYKQDTADYCGPICAERDFMESLLFREAVEILDKPVLGICRGIQLFNALTGGTLYQDLTSEFDPHIAIVHQQQPPYDQPAHTVQILDDSPLHTIFNTNKIKVNSYHHQAIKKLSYKLEPMAQSDDGLIEAVYMPEQHFAMAVQWHPEYMPDDKYSKRLFKAFIEA